MDEDKELDEQEQEKQREINEANKTAHTVGQAVAMGYGGAKGAKLYNAASKTKTGQAVERQIGKQIRRNPVANRLSKRLNRSGAIDKLVQQWVVLVALLLQQQTHLMKLTIKQK